MTRLDRRLHAFRPDLADSRLKGRVEASHFIDGEAAWIGVPVADLRPQSRPDSGIDTQLLYGSEVTVFDEREGWAWIQAKEDGYVGYAPAAALRREKAQMTHVVTVPRTFVYVGADLKLPCLGAHSMGAAVRVVATSETRGTLYAILPSGEAMIASHLAEIGSASTDAVSFARTLEHTPYLWGGTSGFGIDCSGLVQLCFRMAGKQVPRDTDMQAEGFGHAIEVGDDLSGVRRGDLVFWKGHVAMMEDDETIIHASGHTMTVTRERLRDAVERIGYLYGPPTGFRRA